MTNNEIIAKFMREFEPFELKPYQLMYDKSWDWLMPVVEKISKIQYEDGDYSYPRTFGMTSLDTGDWLFRFNRFTLHKNMILFNAVYEAVIEYIEDYNLNK
jgi:hypothetical protein